MSPLKTIYLASGRSSRMRPISDKNLLPFAGQPLCVHLMQGAIAGGAGDFVVVTNGDNTDDVKQALAAANISAQFTVQKDMDQGAAGGIADGLALVDDEDSVLIICGNDSVDASAYASLIQAIDEGYHGAILSKKVQKYFPGGYMQTDEQGIIQSIVEKPGEGNEPSDLVNIMCHGFARAGDLKAALANAKSFKDDIYEVALDSLFKSGQYKAVPYAGHWQAIKYPWHVLATMDLMLSDLEPYTDPTADVHPTAIITGPVHIAAGARVMPYACISGPAYIGPGALVGNGALVRGSMIGTNSIVGYNTEIARSWLANDVTTHIAYIGDSIIDSGANFGASSTTANLRLDGKTVRVDIKGQKIDTHRPKLGAIVGAGAQIGIHACLMPGAKVDPGELVQPSSIKK